MNIDINLGRDAAAALLRALDGLNRELAASTPSGGLTWLRTLAVVTAELEFTLLRCPRTDWEAVATECRELHDLLTGAAPSNREFAERYGVARRSSARLSALHDHVIAIGSAVTALAQDQADAEAAAATRRVAEEVHP